MEKDRICDLIRKALTERILDGTYGAGDKLIELHIAKEFGTSQAPVREALKELESAGLVQSEPYRGTRVRAVSAREVRDAYFARGLLEQGAVESAVLNLQVHLGELRAVYEAMLQAARARDYAMQATCNHQFHRMIVENSENEVLLRLWDSLAFEARTRARLNRPEADPEQDVLSHLPILEAIEAGDSATAGLLLRNHANSFAPEVEEE
ncbi:GntR family transcriptional regulator [Gimesia sp.]|uniref:GntR family transcriptional regulator n=1 Tax=Gimesia sp. TaxID=2024833 RepID=UPI003A90EF31